MIYIVVGSESSQKKRGGETYVRGSVLGLAPFTFHTMYVMRWWKYEKSTRTQNARKTNARLHRKYTHMHNTYSWAHVGLYGTSEKKEGLEVVSSLLVPKVCSPGPLIYITCTYIY